MKFSKAFEIGFQSPSSPIMEGIFDLHNYIFFYLILIFVFVVTVFFQILYDFCFVYNSDFYNEDDLDVFYEFSEVRTVVHGSILEIVWTIVPSIILFFISIPSFSLLYEMDEIVDPKQTFKVIGNQWYWTYEVFDKNSNEFVEIESYMRSVEDMLKVFNNNDAIIAYKYTGRRLLEVDNSLYIPSKTEMRAIVTASDVLHSWAIPSFGVKIDAVPGRLNQIPIYVNVPGIYYGQCSEICGVNHGFMPIRVVAYLFCKMYLANLFFINSIILSVIIVFGILFFSKNFMIVLISIELFMLSVNFFLISGSIYFDDFSVQFIILFLLSIAAAEAALGLAIVILQHRIYGNVNLYTSYKNIKGLKIDGGFFFLFF